MHSQSRDPRAYVKQVPLPVYIPKGVKVQARSLQVFNPTIPSREDMRKANIRRRNSQMTSQGFRSVNFKPYHGIGDPFYLDQRQLILHALGQLDESGDASNRYGGERDDGIDLEEDAHIQRKSKSASKFVLKRDRKGLSCLNKEVVKGRTLVRNVKLGHGLFDLIKQQRHLKRAELEAERRRKEEAARTDWQPPKMDSSDSDSDSSDDELGQDISLNSFMTEIDRQDTDDEGFDQSLGPESDSPEGKGGVTFSGFGGEVSTQPDTLTVSSRAVSSRKKKTQELRPYTPQHNSLAESDDLHSCSKEALFRQLCALYWILESMNMDQPTLLGPVSQSWNLRQIGGRKIPAKHAQDKRLAETRWDQFVSKDFVPRGGKRVSTGRSRITPRRMTIHPRHSILSIGSTSSVLTPNSPRNTSFVIPEASPVPSSQEVTSVAAGDVEEDTGKNSTIFKFLDEYYASLDKERENLDLAEGQGAGHQDVTSGGQSERRGTEVRPEGSSSSPRKSASGMGVHYDGKPGDFHSTSDQRNMSARSNTSNSQVLRPKSSPALMEFQASLPSNKLGELPKEMKEKFNEIKGDKAAELNYDLELLERNRLKSCQNKFVAMSVLASQGRGFHRTLEGMRTPTVRKSQKALQQQRLRKKSSIHCSWFTDLLDSLPENVKKEWQFAKILHRLTKYGLKVFDSSIESQLDEHSVDGNGKQSVYKFLNILKNLRTWEICNPDVCAAIEFCRRNIVEMTVSEFEEWFLQTFPTIDRPQTAPPNLKNSRKGGKSASTISKG